MEAMVQIPASAGICLICQAQRHPPAEPSTRKNRVLFGPLPRPGEVSRTSSFNQLTAHFSPNSLQIGRVAFLRFQPWEE